MLSVVAVFEALGLKKPLRLCWPLLAAGEADAEDPDFARFKDLLLETSATGRFLPATERELIEIPGAEGGTCAVFDIGDGGTVVAPPLLVFSASISPISVVVASVLCDC